jgi:mRNA interferase RelE/StbE
MSSRLTLIMKKIKSLKKMPRLYGVRLLKGEQQYHRLRQGPHRIIYEINDFERTITILKVGHRREI